MVYCLVFSGMITGFQLFKTNALGFYLKMIFWKYLHLVEIYSVIFVLNSYFRFYKSRAFAVLNNNKAYINVRSEKKNVDVLRQSIFHTVNFLKHVHSDLLVVYI